MVVVVLAKPTNLSGAPTATVTMTLKVPSDATENVRSLMLVCLFSVAPVCARRRCSSLLGTGGVRRRPLYGSRCCFPLVAPRLVNVGWALDGGNSAQFGEKYLEYEPQLGELTTRMGPQQSTDPASFTNIQSY